MAIIYLHGFNSDENSTTIKEIRKAIPGLLSISYDYINADIAFEQIRSLIEHTLQENPELLLAGTSLGGFWANYFAQKYQLKCIIVNPAIEPSVSLRKAVAESPIPNYNTGQLKEFRSGDADAYQKYEVPVDSGIIRTIVLGRNDEVIDYRISEKVFKNKGNIIITDEGHRIEDYNRIINLLENVVLEK